MTLSRDLDDRIRDYDFEWVESYLGRPIPSVFKEPYVKGRVFDLENIVVHEADLFISVANWAPQNKLGYSELWPGTENRLILADDWFGNQYHAFPNEAFQLVYFFDHETGETTSMGIDIPFFIAKLEQHKNAP